MYSAIKRSFWCAVFIAIFLVPAMAAQEGAGRLSPDAVLVKLKEGNTRFFNQQRQFPNLGPARLAETLKGQHPYATVLACSDSRVPVEHIFDAGIGDIFVIKVAGNVVDTDETGSIEYGAEHLATPVVVVMGHTSCGAVTAAARGDHALGSIPALIEHIAPAVQKAKKIAGNDFSEGLVDASVRMNVYQSIEDIFSMSHVVGELVKENRLKVIGAVYHIDSGKVEWLGQHPDQKVLLSSSDGPLSSCFGGRCIQIIIAGILIAMALGIFIWRKKASAGK